MVKNYTDAQLLSRAKKINGFNNFPKNYWLLGVREAGPITDKFGCKLYLFREEKFISVMSGTTHTGLYGTQNFEQWNKNGVAILVADEWYYDSFTFGKHKGKVDAFVQTSPLKIIRDNNKNNLMADVGRVREESNIGINIHPNTYDLTKNTSGDTIGKWSVGCTVINNIPKYRDFINLCKNQKTLSYCLLNEF